MWGREFCVCVSVRKRESESERERVCVRKNERESERVRERTWMCFVGNLILRVNVKVTCYGRP